MTENNLTRRESRENAFLAAFSATFQTDAPQEALQAHNEAGALSLDAFANRFNTGQIRLFAQFFKKFGQGSRVVEHRIALPQPQLTGPYRQEPFAIANNLSGPGIKNGQRGCVIACIQTQGQHDAEGASGSASRATAPSSPLTNW